MHPQPCVQLAKAVCHEALTFDVTTAFLSGKHVDREALVKAPMEGLPASQSSENLQFDQEN